MGEYALLKSRTADLTTFRATNYHQSRSADRAACYGGGKICKCIGQTSVVKGDESAGHEAMGILL